VQAGWAAGLAVVLGIAVASFRRGRGRKAGYVAAILCLLGIGAAAGKLADAWLRGSGG
jgi:hypothetical protein